MQDVFIHPSSLVDAPCEIGSGTKIWHFCHVCAGARIGAGCSLGQNVFVAPNVVLGNNVKVQNNVSLYEGLTVADDVFLGPSCVFTNISNPRSEIVRRHLYETTVVERGATVGANATIVCGVRIGAFAFIGAGAVVTRDVPAYGRILGVPGRQSGWVSRHGHPLHFDNEQGTAQCPESGLKYHLKDGKVTCADVEEGSPLPASMRQGQQSYPSVKGKPLV